MAMAASRRRRRLCWLDKKTIVAFSQDLFSGFFYLPQSREGLERESMEESEVEIVKKRGANARASGCS